MANISMICHPDTPSAVVTSIDVSYDIGADGWLSLRYWARCTFDKLIIPAPTAAKRTDGLWNDTCFELFVKSPIGSQYLEFNFSPSLNWAGYRFSRYREGMRECPLETPNIVCDGSEASFVLQATLKLPSDISQPVDVGLSAIIQERGDIKSYWALKHPPGKPDFHHKDCFALKLSPPEKV